MSENLGPEVNPQTVEPRHSVSRLQSSDCLVDFALLRLGQYRGDAFAKGSLTCNREDCAIRFEREVTANVEGALTDPEAMVIGKIRKKVRQQMQEECQDWIETVNGQELPLERLPKELRPRSLEHML